MWVENSLRDGARILVVDDEPQLRRMIVDVLRAEGFCAISQARIGHGGACRIPRNEPPACTARCHAARWRRLYAVRIPAVAFRRHAFARDVPYGEERARRSTRGIAPRAPTTTSRSLSPQELVLRVCAVLRRCYPAQPDTLQLAACTLDLSTCRSDSPQTASAYRSP